MSIFSLCFFKSSSLCIIIQNSPSCKNTSHVVLGPIHPVIPPFLDYLCKELSQNMVMFWSSGGIGLQHISLRGEATPSSGEFPKFKYDFTNINHRANTVAFAITLNPGITLVVSYDANHFLWFQVNSNNAKFWWILLCLQGECHGERSVAYGPVAAPLPFFTFV